MSFSKSEAERIAIAEGAPSLLQIPRADNAGAVVSEGDRLVQILHNGLKVLADGYYGPFVTEMIRRTQGVHEPQEEVAFAVVMEHLEPYPVMMELGCYWAFYSMWLHKRHPGAELILIEPVTTRRAVGAANLELNGIPAKVMPHAIGEDDCLQVQFQTGAESETLDIRSIDSLLEEIGVTKLDVLHMDIQGFERLALKGAHKILSRQAIDWLFVSTHRYLEEGARMDLHAACMEMLASHGYMIVASHTPEESFSLDGLIVAKSPGAAGPAKIALDTLTPELRKNLVGDLELKDDCL